MSGILSRMEAKGFIEQREVETLAPIMNTVNEVLEALEIGNEFIVGYGLDYDQLGRNLKDVFVVVNE